MTLPQPSQQTVPILLTPECEAPGCHVAGDQYTMVRCEACGSWFCPNHIVKEEGVKLVHTSPRILRGLAFYQGICSACRREPQQSHH